jgi:hypothetical protein
MYITKMTGRWEIFGLFGIWNRGARERASMYRAYIKVGERDKEKLKKSSSIDMEGRGALVAGFCGILGFGIG